MSFDSKFDYYRDELFKYVNDNNIDVIKELLRRDDINTDMINFKNNGDTVLILAIRKGNTDIVKELLSRDDIDINIKDNLGHTALTLAIMTNNTDVAKELLNRKDIDINHRDIFGNTALLVAIDEYNTDIAKELFNRKEIDINHCNNYGDTALIMAIDKRHSDITIEKCLTDIAKELLNRKEIDINHCNGCGNTALLMAIKRSDIEIVKELLSRKDIDINIKNKNGETALTLANRFGNTEIVEKLLSHNKQSKDENSKDKSNDNKKKNDDKSDEKKNDDDTEYDWERMTWREYHDKNGTTMPIGSLGVYEAWNGPITINSITKGTTENLVELRQANKVLTESRLEINDNLNRDIIRFNSYAHYLNKERKRQAKLNQLELKLENTKNDIAYIKEKLEKIDIGHDKDVSLIQSQCRRLKERQDLEHELSVEQFDHDMNDLMYKLKMCCEEYVSALKQADRNVEDKWLNCNLFKDCIDINRTLKTALFTFFAKYDSEKKVEQDRQEFYKKFTNYHEAMVELSAEREKMFREESRSNRLRELKERHEDDEKERQYRFIRKDTENELHKLEEKKKKLSKRMAILAQ